MAKYSTQFKIKVVQEYLLGNTSYNILCKKYGISSPIVIREWTELAKSHGLESLKVKHPKQSYSINFKLKVVTYYRTHDVGVNKVAAHFNLSHSQVYSWYRIYQKEGIIGLRPKPKGRPRKNMNKRKKKQNQPLLTPTKEEQYQQEIADLKAKLAYAKMENDILKKLRALRQREEKDKR